MVSRRLSTGIGSFVRVAGQCDPVGLVRVEVYPAMGDEQIRLLDLANGLTPPMEGAISGWIESFVYG
jgi:hypothetical protein